MAHDTAPLGDEPDWRPHVLLGLDRPAWPDRTSPRTRLGDVATVRSMPNGAARSGSLLVENTDLDTGQPVAVAARRSVPAWTFQGERGLSAGCVLVPRSDAQPAILVAASDSRRTYAARFTPVRPDPEQLLPEFLWALLSSNVGMDARRRLADGSARPLMPADLAALEIPLPSLAEQQRVADRSRNLTEHLEVRVDRPTPSWSKTVALRDTATWHLQVQFRDLSVLETGTPLGELADIRRSRTQPQTLIERPLPGWLPVIDVRAMRDPRSARWAGPGADILAPGDIVLPPVPDLDATTVSDPSGAGTNTIIVRPHDPADTERIVASLNSATGHELRQALSSRTRILTPADAKRIPISDRVEASPALVEPLGLQLDGLLWP